ncbi:hypothetical protein CPB83DRAFT_863732 [Crepidotus variabilis]|uniref:Uncharacterized protein n=1 Tax=Crepidotus variabilis TaxID=179855 RepID=A0A9P6E5M6_9AGAR|nr:hypothetical protein CPB83DRAFT_863732 [Crepidotus variabilis]
MNNEDFGRMKSLEKLLDGTFRLDVISHGLAGWILTRSLSLLVFLPCLFHGVNRVYERS